MRLLPLRPYGSGSPKPNRQHSYNAEPEHYQKELHSADEVNTYLQSLKDKDKKTKQVNRIAYEYTQSTFDNLESLYDN